MARRCTTVPGYGACCQAAQAGRLNQPVRINTQHGQRCGVCTPVQKRNGQTGFRFRFAKSAECGLAAGGCPVVGQGQIAGQAQPQIGYAPQLQLPNYAQGYQMMR